MKEEVIEEYIKPEQFVPSGGMAVIPGFAYQFFKPSSSSEAMAMNLPPPGNLPKDQSEWDAYFKSLNDNNSSMSMIVTEMPAAGAAAAPNVPIWIDSVTLGFKIKNWDLSLGFTDVSQKMY